MAAQPKFTPGPWSVDFGLCQWILHGRRPQDVIATTDHDQHLSNREITDARLLSAAPDLLAIAKIYAMHSVDCHVRPFGGGMRATWAGDDYKVCTCALGDAIRKAEGRDGT